MDVLPAFALLPVLFPKFIVDPEPVFVVALTLPPVELAAAAPEFEFVERAPFGPRNTLLSPVVAVLTSPLPSTAPVDAPLLKADPNISGDKFNIVLAALLFAVDPLPPVRDNDVVPELFEVPPASIVPSKANASFWAS
jgi:hypothetical protein